MTREELTGAPETGIVAALTPFETVRRSGGRGANRICRIPDVVSQHNAPLRTSNNNAPLARLSDPLRIVATARQPE